LYRLLRSLVAFALAFTAASPAFAEPVSWSSFWTAHTLVISGNNSPGEGDGVIRTQELHPGSVLLITNQINTTVTGSRSITAADVSASYPFFPSEEPFFGDALSFGPPFNDYSLTINLTDEASGESGSLTFTGSLGGSFTVDDASHITNTFLARLPRV
jgi:hypothetical protein